VFFLLSGCHLKAMKYTKNIIGLFNIMALCAVVSVISGCASKPDTPDLRPLPYKKVAVIIDPTQYNRYNSISRGGTSDGITTTMENALQGALLDKGYEVADRSSVEHAMKELGFQGTGLTHEQLARIGNAIGSRGLFIITLTNNEQKVSYTQNGSHTYYMVEISGKLLDVEKISAVWVSNAKYSDKWNILNPAGSMTEAVRKCMESFAQKIPPSASDQ